MFVVDLLACEVEIVKGSVAAVFAVFERSAVEHLSLPIENSVSMWKATRHFSLKFVSRRKDIFVGKAFN